MKEMQATTSWRLHAALLTLWFAASFGVVFFARDLQMVVAGWPVSFWFAAQGSVLIFIAIVLVFAWRKNKDSQEVWLVDVDVYQQYTNRIHRRFGWYVGCLLLALLASCLRACLLTDESISTHVHPKEKLARGRHRQLQPPGL